MRRKSQRLIFQFLKDHLSRLNVPIPLRYFMAALVSLIVGFNIAYRCDPPPYGYPFNELSDAYWGVIIDIARHWRNFDFSLWNPEIGGGISLFTTGQYPLLSPSNGLAWFLKDDHFYLLKLIEPYVIGIFFMSVLLWDEFKTRWYIALFGGLAYMGLVLSKTFALAASPFLLYACGIFPAIVLLVIKLSRRHLFLGAAAAGALLALQFLSQGSIQTPQMLVWWTIFFCVYAFSGKGHFQNLNNWKNWLGSLGMLVVFSIGLCAIQMLPSLYYIRDESARLSGYYSLHNFTLFSSSENLAQVIWQGFFAGVPVRAKTFLVLCLVAIALGVRHWGRVFAKTPNKAFVYQLWLTITIYFSFSTVVAWLIQILPPLGKVFTPLTLFNIKYGIYTLDFAIVLSVCLVLNENRLSFFSQDRFSFLKFLALTVLGMAFLVGILPIFMTVTKDYFPSLISSVFGQAFFSENSKAAIKLLISTLFFLMIFALRPKHVIFHIILAFFLLGTGFMMTLDCFKWYDKGKQGDLSLYQVGNPEQVFYTTEASGKYVLPYDVPPDWTMHNFNLLYQVRGTAGFLGAPPLRLTRFIFYFEDPDSSLPFPGGHTKFGNFKIKTPAALISYFPAELTFTLKDERLDWPGFKRVVTGEKYDIHERVKPVERIYTASQLEVVDFSNLIKAMKNNRGDTIYVSREDAKASGLQSEHLQKSKNVQITNFQRPSKNKIVFHAIADQPFFAVFPESYQKDWRLTIDGKKERVFPAYYLFNGFKVPAGEHQVTMTFVPRGFEAGAVINILSVFFLGWLFFKFRDKKHG